MRQAILKLGATVLTLGATAASALFVTSHLKNVNAPLQPPVLNSTTSMSGVVVIGPTVQPTDQPPLTSTYAS